MVERSFRGFVEASLDGLSCEFPRMYDRLVARLDTRRVTLTVDNEVCLVHALAGRIELSDTATDAHVELTTDSRTIVDLADGVFTVEQAIWDNRIHLCGSVDDLIVFHELLQIFLHGSVRSPSSPARMERFVRWSRRHRPGVRHVQAV